MVGKRRHACLLMPAQVNKKRLENEDTWYILIRYVKTTSLFGHWPRRGATSNEQWRGADVITENNCCCYTVSKTVKLEDDMAVGQELKLYFYPSIGGLKKKKKTH